MNRYNDYALAPHASAANCPSGFNQSFKNERHEDRASLSGSEDGSYAVYGDIQKTDADIEGAFMVLSRSWSTFDNLSLEEANVALTSQTLNADGTPKRPMNAFMIFARRRRPQVSSENQAMRTGEISKLLSKEWVGMPAVNTLKIYSTRDSFSSVSSMKSSSTLNKPNSSRTHSIRNTQTMFIVDDLIIQGNVGVLTLT